MKKYLDYEGLKTYHKLIDSLVKSGDSELLSMINEIKDMLEGSDPESVENKLADLKSNLEDKISEMEESLKDDIKTSVDEAVDKIVGGAPEALDTLKEIVDMMASDQEGVAELMSEVVANKKAIEDNKKSIDDDIKNLSEHIEAAAEAFDNHEERLDNIESEIHGTISDAEIALLFANDSQDTDTVKYADSASSITSITPAQAKVSDLIVTSDSAVNAPTENKTYKNISIGSTDIDTKLTVKAVEAIAIDGANINGRGEEATGNGSINFAAKDLTVQNVNISGNTNYNVFEGTQDLTNNSSHIENLYVENIVVDDPSIKHNIVNVYTPANGAKIYISDSKFTLNADNSNVLRMANYLNSDNVEITFSNCEWNYVGGDMKWAGLMIYQPASADAALNGDMSHIATWKIKFVNCKYNGDLITENVEGDHQALYTYNINKSGACVGGADAITSVGWNVVFE